MSFLLHWKSYRTFDLGTAGDTGDSLTFGSNVQTGNMFGSSGSLNCKLMDCYMIKIKREISLGNFTGPYVAPVCSDDMNTAMNMGYSIGYLLLPCWCEIWLNSFFTKLLSSNEGEFFWSRLMWKFDHQITVFVIRIGYFEILKLTCSKSCTP